MNDIELNHRVHRETQRSQRVIEKDQWSYGVFVSRPKAGVTIPIGIVPQGSAIPLKSSSRTSSPEEMSRPDPNQPIKPIKAC